MDTLRKKDLKNAYQAKPAIGGVYSIQCSGNRRVWIKSTLNMAGQQNKFAFSISIHSCPDPGMRKEWIQYGEQSFSFAVLETLQKKETQTEAEFAEDISVLHTLWLEKRGSSPQAS